MAPVELSVMKTSYLNSSRRTESQHLPPPSPLPVLSVQEPSMVFFHQAVRVQCVKGPLVFTLDYLLNSFTLGILAVGLIDVGSTATRSLPHGHMVVSQ